MGLEKKNYPQKILIGVNLFLIMEEYIYLWSILPSIKIPDFLKYSNIFFYFFGNDFLNYI